MRLTGWQWSWVAASLLAIIPFAWLALQFVDYLRQPTVIDPNVVALLDAPEKCWPGSLSEVIDKYVKTSRSFHQPDHLIADCIKVERALAKYPGIRSGKDYRVRIKADSAYKAGQWPWVVGGSVVGWLTFIALLYFAGWTVAWAEANRLSEKRKAQIAEALGSMTNREAIEIVQRYGKARLVYDAPVPGGVADEGKLPDRKGRIKKALLLRLAEEEDEQTREHLRTGYVLLANFQPGVGEENIGGDVMAMGAAGGPQSDAAAVAIPNEACEKWRPIVEKEREELMSDLKRLDACDTTRECKDRRH